MNKPYVPLFRTYAAPRASEVKLCQERDVLLTSIGVNLSFFYEHTIYDEDF